MNLLSIALLGCLSAVALPEGGGPDPESSVPSATSEPDGTSPSGRHLVAMLHGGGPEADDLFGRFVSESNQGRIVTIGSNEPADPDLAFFDGYFRSLGAVGASTVNTTSRADADALSNVALVDAADALFFRGGDQAAYLEEWTGTRLHEAIVRAVERGVPVAGTSAGCAILGERIYDARVASVDAWQALDDPFDPGLTFSGAFVDLLPGVLTDTHFTERGRLGRLAVFLARWQEEGGDDVVGLGVDPETALYVYDDGSAEVMGIGSITVLRPPTERTVLPGESVDLRGMRLWQLPAGYTVDLDAPDVVLGRPTWVAAVPPIAPLLPWVPGRLDGDDRAHRQLGDRVIPEIDAPDDPWYRGELTEAPGRSELPGAFVLTRLYDDSDRFEAHIGGMMWTLGRHPGTIGIGIDIDHRAFDTDPAGIRVERGWALIVDTRTATFAGDPGGVPQTVAIEGATVHVIGEGSSWLAP